jgi:tRNA threonylcarbamoyladenosine biosynthesis protein TsaE
MAIELHPAIVKSLHWPDEARTAAFAAVLAQALLATGGNASIALHGDLGAGKTTFVRHLLRALGVEGRIKSPTYAVVEPYTVTAGSATLSQKLNIWHFDFYRFNDPDEWEEAGFRDIFASPGLKLVEWPDKAGPHLPPPDLHIDIDMTADDARQVTLRASSPSGQALMGAAE